MRITLFLLAMAVLASPPALSGELVFPLPRMTGDFGIWMDTLTYAGDSAQVLSVKILVEATIESMGYQECYYPPPVGPGFYTCPLGVIFWGSVRRNFNTNTRREFYWLDPEYPGGYLEILLPTYSGFTELSTGDVIHVRFLMGTDKECCEYEQVQTQLADATLTSVTLIIEISDEVPVESSTWGRIKSLYR